MLTHLPDMAAKRALLNPEKVAFSDRTTNHDWTYAHVNESAARLAAYWLQNGLSEGDRVIYLGRTRAEFFVALFAAQKSGVILAPLNWRDPISVLIDRAKWLDAKAIVYDTHSFEAAQGILDATSAFGIALHGSIAGFGAADKCTALTPKPVLAGRTWYLIFTSGSSGAPKAVINTARMAWANAVNLSQAIDLTQQDASLGYLSIAHTAGINLVTLPMFLTGGRTVVLPDFDASQVLNELKQPAVTCFFGVPTIYQMLAEHPAVASAPWSELRNICGGEALRAPIAKTFSKLGARLRPGYGLTESGPTTFVMDEAALDRKPGSVGQLQSLTDLRFDGGEQEGEILLRGPSITPGYFQNEAASAQAFTADGWFRTGDIGQLDADNYMTLIGRAKELYISGGVNVTPSEVETAIYTHKDVTDCAVLSIPDPKWGEAGVAFVTLKNGTNTSDIMQHCSISLAGPKQPKHVIALDDFPRSASGKIDKSKLSALLP